MRHTQYKVANNQALGSVTVRKYHITVENTKYVSVTIFIVVQPATTTEKERADYLERLYDI